MISSLKHHTTLRCLQSKDKTRSCQRARGTNVRTRSKAPSFMNRVAKRVDATSVRLGARTKAHKKGVWVRIPPRFSHFSRHWGIRRKRRDMKRETFAVGKWLNRAILSAVGQAGEVKRVWNRLVAQAPKPLMRTAQESCATALSNSRWCIRTRRQVGSNTCSTLALPEDQCYCRRDEG